MNRRCGGVGARRLPIGATMRPYAHPARKVPGALEAPPKTIPTPCLQRRHRRAAEFGLQALTSFRSKGDRYGTTISLFGVGMLYAALGALAKSEEILREAAALASATQNIFHGAVIPLHLGFVLAAQSTLSKQEEARSIGDAFAAQPHLGPAIRGASHQILAQVGLVSGDVALAESRLRIALAAYTMLLPYRAQAMPLLAKDAESRELANTYRREYMAGVEVVNGSTPTNNTH